MVSIFFPYKCLISHNVLSHGNIMTLVIMHQVTYAKGLYLHLLYCSSVKASQESFWVL